MNACTHRCRVSSAVLMCALSGNVLMLGGCPNARHYPGIDIRDFDNTSLVVGVPPIAQTKEFQCGYACIAAIAMYHGVDPDRFTQGLIPDTFGKRMLSAKDLAAIAEKVGLVAFAYSGNLEDLRKNIGKQRPVMALLANPPRTESWPSPRWAFETAGAGLAPAHWVIIIGFSDKTGDIILHDPRQGRLVMSRGAFQHAWKKHSSVSVLIGVRGNPQVTSSPRGLDER